MKRPKLLARTRGKAEATPISKDAIQRADDPFYRERIKALRAKLESRINSERHPVFAVTSSVAGEGKTLLAANLALHLAATGNRKVLLVDTDLRKACIASYFDMPVSPGVCEHVSDNVGVEAIVRSSRHPNLAIVTSGKLGEDPAALLAGRRFRAFLESIRSQFDVTVLDTAPVLPAADTLGLREQVNGFLFVFRAGFTPHTAFRQAVDEIGEKQIIGVVLNGVEQKSRRYYEKYYGSYYHRPIKERR